MVLFALYIFIMPYQKLYVNLLESFVLSDLTVLLLAALTDRFKVGCVHVLYTKLGIYVHICMYTHTQSLK